VLFIPFPRENKKDIKKRRKKNMELNTEIKRRENIEK
jgi:hypothetical protein